MPSIAVLGERAKVQGFALAGGTVVIAEDPVAVRSAWAGLGNDVAIVVLTPQAANALASALCGAPRNDSPLWAVMPG